MNAVAPRFLAHLNVVRRETVVTVGRSEKGTGSYQPAKRKSMVSARISLFLFAISGIFATGALAQVGFETGQVVGPAGETLDVGIWYPTTSRGKPQALGPYRQDVAINSMPQGSRRPLVVMSHGSGGWFGGHYDTALALAKAGFVVAAVTHQGDNFVDDSHKAEVWLRPPQLRALTDYMLREWVGRARIETTRIGVFGFSSGGFTALVAVGGKPHLERLAEFCATRQRQETCGAYFHATAAARSEMASLPASSWEADPRIRAAVIAAPALGFTFGADGLTGIRAPIQLWAAMADEVLPGPDYAGAVRAGLPLAPEFHAVKGAGHFDFMAPCSSTLATQAPAICTKRKGFDRTRFHRSFNADVVRFFRRTLAG